MKSAPDKATGPVKPLVMLGPHLAPQLLEGAIRSSLDAGCEAGVVTTVEGPVSAGLFETPGVHRFARAPHDGRREAVRALAAAAGRMGMTHLITLDPVSFCEKAIAGIVAQTRATPEAVVCGVRRLEPAQGTARAGWGRSLANFWFRVQTGIRMADSTSGLRAYPLGVIKGIKPLSRGASFDYEMLVRSAWAGADIREVDAPATPCRFGSPASFARRTAEGLVHIGLNFHLTMRSITPWPHRQITRCDPGAGAATVSLLHPWRSLKILVGQNISARRLGQAAALGVFLGTLPLIACHSIAILFAAGYFRLSKVAALSASQLCMPPIVPALCVEAGYFIRHGAFLTEISLRTLRYEALDRLLEWLIGSLIMAPVLAAAVGGLVYLMARHIERRIGSGPAAPAAERRN